MYQKKIIISVFLLLLFGVMITVIKIDGDQNNEVVNLNFRITWEEHSGRGDAIYGIVEEFNQNNDSIHVTMVGGNEDTDVFRESLTTDEIDIYVTPYRFIQYGDFSEELLVFTDDFLQELDNYYDTIVDLASRDGQVYGMPWIGHSMALIYNKDITDELEIYPEDWDSYEDLLMGCERVFNNSDHYGLGLVGADHHDVTWMVNQFIYTFGGSLVERDESGSTNKVVINSEESEKALEFYIDKLGTYAQEGWREHTGREVIEVFGKGEIAFEIQGPWAISDVWKRGSPFEVGVIPLCQLGIYSEVGPLMLTISKDSAYIEEAKIFVQYLIEKSTLEKIMDGEYSPKHDAFYPFRVPLRKDMEQSEFFEKYPEFLAFIEGFAMPSINTPSKEWALIQEEKYAYVLHETINGNLTIQDALKEVEE